MSTQAQLEANRTNAQKSTGPRTPQGKTITAKNALKHGLLAQRFIVSEQDRQAFEDFRGNIVTELAPHGQLETVFADRVATLSWRLSRIDNIQISVLNILADEMAEEIKGYSDEYIKLEMDPPAIYFSSKQAKEEYILGKTIIKDFIGEKVLEKLSAYERRIQRDLLATRKELYLLQNLRKQSEAEAVGANLSVRPSAAQGSAAPSPVQHKSRAAQAAGCPANVQSVRPNENASSDFRQTNPISQKSSFDNRPSSILQTDPISKMAQALIPCPPSTKY